MKRTIHGILILLLFLTANTFAQELPLPATGSPAALVPGQLIIKFKDEGNERFTGCAVCLIADGEEFADFFADKGKSIDALNKQFKVNKAQRIFGLDQRATALEARAARKQLIAGAKAKFNQRSQRIPDNVDLPDLSNVYLFDVPASSNIEEVCNIYRQDSHVEFAQPNYLMTTSFLPNDPYYSTAGTWGQAYDDLWALKKMNAASAWDTAQGAGVIVAIVDTGVDAGHPDIADNIWINSDDIAGDGFDNDNNEFIDDVAGWDFYNNDNNPSDGHGHGTHLAGSIAAVINNGAGIAGVAPQAKIMPLKGLSDQGGGTTVALVQAIDYATLNGADIIHNSWGCGGGRCPSQPAFELAVHQAYVLGAIVVFSAGNDNDDVVYYSPKNWPETFVIGASTTDDQRASFSNYGAKLDAVAPGIDILSLNANGGSNTIFGLCPTCSVDGDYLRLSGTSMAATYGSGLAALILSVHPGFNQEQVRQVMHASADDIATPGFDFYTGAGRLNAARAVLVQNILNVRISEPAENNFTYKQDGRLVIKGDANGPAFEKYQLFYSENTNPPDWLPLAGPFNGPVSGGVLANVDVTNLGANDYYLYLVVSSLEGLDFEQVAYIHPTSPPSLVMPAAATVNEGQPLTLTVAGVHSQSHALALESLGALPAGANFSVGAVMYLGDGTSRIDGILSWTPGGTQAGNYSFNFHLSDDQGNNVLSDPLAVTVMDAPNTIPMITAVQYQGGIMMWTGKDREDGINLNYSYRFDNGAFSAPSKNTILSVAGLGLAKGKHLFEVKAIDSFGAESKLKSKGITIN